MRLSIPCLLISILTEFLLIREKFSLSRQRDWNYLSRKFRSHISMSEKGSVVRALIVGENATHFSPSCKKALLHFAFFK